MSCAAILWLALQASPVAEAQTPAPLTRALLLDEPFSKLDTTLRAQMREFTFTTLRERRVPVVLVTHDAADIPPGAQVVNLDA